MKRQKVWKVFSGNAISYEYSKDAALERRVIYQNLGITKTMIKGRCI